VKIIDPFLNYTDRDTQVCRGRCASIAIYASEELMPLLYPVIIPIMWEKVNGV
jgi:hypothetical protein